MFGNAVEREELLVPGWRQRRPPRDLAPREGPQEARAVRQDQRLARRAVRLHARDDAPIREGETTLLDNSMVLFGSALRDGNSHNPHNLPILARRQGRRGPRHGPAPGLRQGHAALQPLCVHARPRGGEGRPLRRQHGATHRARRPELPATDSPAARLTGWCPAGNCPRAVQVGRGLVHSPSPSEANSPAPTEANPRRRAKPIRGAERSQNPPFGSLRSSPVRDARPPDDIPRRAKPIRRAERSQFPRRRAKPILPRRPKPIPLRRAKPIPGVERTQRRSDRGVRLNAPPRHGADVRPASDVPSPTCQRARDIIGNRGPSVLPIRTEPCLRPSAAVPARRPTRLNSPTDRPRVLRQIVLIPITDVPETLTRA